MKLSILTLLLSTVMANASFAITNPDASKTNGSAVACKNKDSGKLTRNNEKRQVVASSENIKLSKEKKARQ